MLQINPDTVCELILRVREYQAKEPAPFPEEASNPTDDETGAALGASDGDLTEQEILATLRDLEPDQQVELVALMWLGRGDFEVADWGACRDEAGAQWTARTPEYLLSTPLLGDYLEEGLNLLDYQCNE
jgi:hypothetical protein